MNLRIKKRFKILIISTLSFLTLIITVFLLIFYSSIFQTYITSLISSYLSKDSNVDISIESVDISFFNHLILNNVKVVRNQNDTIFDIGSIDLAVKDFDTEKQIINLENLTLNNAGIFLRLDSTDKFNIEDFTNLFTFKTDSNSKPWFIFAKSLNINNTHFIYHTFDCPVYEYGMNYWDLDISNIKLSISDIELKTDSITFTINHIEADEKSGFRLNHFYGNCLVKDSLIRVSNLLVNSRYTTVSADYYDMRFAKFSDFLDYNNKVRMVCKLNNSFADMRDIAFFAPATKDMDLKTIVSGFFDGTVNNFKGKNFKFLYGDKSYIKTSFNFSGLPDYEETFMYIKIDSLITNKADIETVKMYPFNLNEYVKLPNQVEKMGQIFYKGNFTGFYNDFVAYGTFKTDAGTINTDVMLKKLSRSKTSLKGKVTSDNLNIGKIFDISNYAQNTSFNTNINGYITGDSLNMKVKGTVSSLNINNYTYKNISIDGEVQNKMFDGLFQVNDSNLTMDFIGRFDFNNNNSVMDFTADVKNINLYNTNIYKKDSLTNLSFRMVSKYTGLDIDKITGYINIFNLKLSDSKKNLEIKDFRFSSRKTGKEMRAILFSDFMDINIEGHYRLVDLIKSTKYIISNYTPKIFEKEKNIKKIYNNKFKFTLTFKENKDIFSFFIDNSEIQAGSTIKGFVNTHKQEIKIISKIPELKINNTKISNIRSYINTKNDTLVTFVRFDSINLFNKISLARFAFSFNTYQNQSDIHLAWGQDIANNSDIFAKLKYRKQKEQIQVKYDFIPSYFVLDSNIWYINDFGGIIDSSGIQINGLTINKDAQYLYADGKLSGNKNDSLQVFLNQLQLHHILQTFVAGNANIYGYCDGEALIKNFFGKMLINSELKAYKLSINKTKFGSINLYSQYFSGSNRIKISAKTVSKQELNKVNLKGYYYTNKDNLILNLNISKLEARTFSRYINDYVNKIHGLFNADLKITGNISSPVVNGKIKADRLTAFVNYLKTAYSFSDYIYLKKNKIRFSDAYIFDENANQAILNGNISHNNFSDFKFDLNLKFNDFMALNTGKKDNDLFYGKAILDGSFFVQGTPDMTKLNLIAETKRGTKLFIPLSNPETVSTNDFITFVNKNNTPETPEKEQEESSVLEHLDMKFALNFTPDADIQIIFDEKMGDILKVRGNGNIVIKSNKKTPFDIRGEYFISKGTYLFTLQNILNKKFNIKPGSYIRWSGDVYNAETMVDAVYKLKASPYNLTLNPEDKPRIPVECELILSNKLMKPDIEFKLNIPTANDRLRNIIAGLSPEELNKQILFLLITNNFYTNQELLAGSNEAVGGNAIGKTSGEVLSNQVSNWLSQISDDFDIGVNYRPGDDISKDELEVALSTQILNDRVILNGNVGFGEYKTQNSTTNSVAGNFDVEVLLNKKGNLRLKAYNHVNDNYAYKNSLYTQGVGIFYREEFNSIDELKKKYLKTLKKLLKQKIESKYNIKDAENQHK